MLSLLTFAIYALTILVVIGALWLATWAYRKLSITAFLWIAVTKLTGMAVGLLSVATNREKTDQAVKYLQDLAQRSDVSLGQMTASIIYFGQLFPLLVTLFLGLIVVCEITHLDPSLAQHRFFALIYRVRWVLGLLAVGAVITRSVIFNYALESLP